MVWVKEANCMKNNGVKSSQYGGKLLQDKEIKVESQKCKPAQDIGVEFGQPRGKI